MLLHSNCGIGFMYTGWAGELKLTFELRAGKSVLTSRWSRGPFVIQKPFYYEDDVPHVYLLHPPGGLVGGDQLNLEVNLESGSHALLTTPGATKFYRSECDYSFVEQKFNIKSDSVLEWLPQCNIFFPKSKAIIKSILQVSHSARFIFFESLYFSDLVLHRWFEEGISLDSYLCVYLDNNYIGFKNRLRVNISNQLGFEKLAGCQISATFFAMPICFGILEKVRYIINMYNPRAGSATLLDHFLVVRLLDNQDQKIRNLLYDLWCFLRPIVIGKEVIIPRIWMT